MRRTAIMAVALCGVAFLMIMAGGCSNQDGVLDPTDSEPLLSSKVNPDPGPDEDALPMNLSFPVIWAYPPSDILLAPYVFKTESITKTYSLTSYPYADPAIVDYLQANDPWYPQPPYANENTWAAEYLVSDATHMIHFVDWGNPMENIAAQVGWRFPVEVALYEKIGEMTYDEYGEEAGIAGTTMEAYTMACLEYPASRDELFGTNKNKYGSCFATVLTTEFFVTVRKLDGGAEYNIRLDPAVGPSGKMNFASANGGWTPTEAGWHRVTLYITDPNISFANAFVANDDHFDMKTGEQFGELSPHKKELSGIFYNSTWIDVYVEEASGRHNQ